MTLALTKWGWPNLAAIMALAALPFLAVLLPAANPAPLRATAVDTAAPHVVVAADIAED